MADGEQPAVLHPNASLLPYELFQPRCLHRLLEEQQKKKDFKAGLKDEWMRARIKGASKYEVQKKKKKRSGGSQNTNTVIVTRGRAEGRDSAAPASRLIYFFMGV